jgi:carbon-monoxide dehydrogenase iron sulfur subunit
MGKLIFVDPEKCVGCMSCVMACSMEHGEMIGPSYSRILPVRLKREVVNIPVVCRQCGKPLCADACPMGAIKRDENTGAMVVDSDLCIACGMCMVACPLGGIASIDRKAGTSVKCDLCAGDPVCVKFCGYGAIEYISEEEAAYRKRKGSVKKMAEVLELLNVTRQYGR